MGTLWGREPALIIGFVQAVIVLVVAFGFNLTTGEQAAILSVTAAALGLLTRTQVTPNASVGLTIDTKRAGAILLAIGIGAGTIALPACSASARHRAVVADVSIHAGLASLQDSEMALFKAGELATTPAENEAIHKRINKALVPALRSEDAFNRLVRNWQPGQPAPAELQQHVADLRVLINEITVSLPDGTAKSQLMGWIAVGENAALAVIVNLPTK